jgi:uncharacterized cupredoxin-like copper-binding protein
LIARRVAVAVAGVSLFALAACSGGAGGASGGGAAGGNTVAVTTNNYKFQTNTTTYASGQPIKFDVRNSDTVAHEFLIMPKGEKDPAKKLAGVLENDLPAGKSASVSFTFPAKGDYEIACHIPGHYEAGMVLPISVS